MCRRAHTLSHTHTHTEIQTDRHSRVQWRKHQHGWQTKEGKYMEALTCMEKGLVMRQHFYGTHSDEVFKCVYCECEYTSKRNLWRHVKRMHPAKMEEYAIKYQIKHKGLGSIKKRKEKKENCTECPYCDKTIEKHGLWRHIQTSHAKLYIKS